MKHLKTILAVAVVALAMGLPSIATAQYPDQRLNQFLDHHPDVRHDLERNPDLIFNSRYRRQHVELEEFMQGHQGIWGKLHGANRWGAYGPDHNWHESDWWHEHDPDWMHRNHPEWAENHPEWRGEVTHEEHHAAEEEHYHGNPHEYGGPPPNQPPPPNHGHHGDHNPH